MGAVTLPPPVLGVDEEDALLAGALLDELLGGTTTPPLLELLELAGAELDEGEVFAASVTLVLFTKTVPAAVCGSPVPLAA